MEFSDIGRLVDELVGVLKEEWYTKVKAETARTMAATLQARLLADAYAEGVIDGRNADIRKYQEVVLLADDPACQKAMADLSVVEHRASVAEIERKRAEAVISLTRAWLYSQRPTP